MNINQSKRTMQPSPLYQCANSSCGLESGDIGQALPASELYWSGISQTGWAWRCMDCISAGGMERLGSLSAFMAEERPSYVEPSPGDVLLDSMLSLFAGHRSMEIVTKTEDRQDDEVECECGATTRGHAVWIYNSGWRRYLRCPLCHEELVPEGDSDE